MIQIPDSFILGGRIWDVQYVDVEVASRLYPDVDFTDEEGYCDPIRAHILLFINEEFTHVNYLHVFLHEFGHARRFNLGEVDHCEEEVDTEAQQYLALLTTKRGKNKP